MSLSCHINPHLHHARGLDMDRTKEYTKLMIRDLTAVQYEAVA
jgi:hypothetical protein